MKKKEDKNYNRELKGVNNRESKEKREEKEKRIPEPYHTEESILTPEDLKESESEWGPDIAMESAPSYVTIPKKQGEFTVEDYYALPDDYRCELIDGVIYDMSAPNLVHQTIAFGVCEQIRQFIGRKGGRCKSFLSPVDVQLSKDDKTMVQPDVIVVCDREKWRDLRVIYGAPDLVIEVLSKSTAKKDRIIKLAKYRENGVREYWMIDPYAQRVVVHCFKEPEEVRIYGIETEVPVAIFEGKCKIDLKKVYEEVESEWGPDIAMEAAPSYVTIPKKQGEFTVEDYYALPDDYRCELIDGVIYDMSAPKSIHQYFVGQIHRCLDEYIESKRGKCIAYLSPIDVRLDRDNRTMVQPDVLVLCKRDQLFEWGIEGAPDLVIEVLSKSTAKKDRIIKLRKYREAGVREYWMVDTYAQRVVAYQFGEQEESRIYGFETEVPVGIFDGECRIDMGRIYGRIAFVNQNEETEKKR